MVLIAPPQGPADLSAKCMLAYRAALYVVGSASAAGEFWSAQYEAVRRMTVHSRRSEQPDQSATVNCDVWDVCDLYGMYRAGADAGIRVERCESLVMEGGLNEIRGIKLVSGLMCSQRQPALQYKA